MLLGWRLAGARFYRRNLEWLVLLNVLHEGDLLVEVIILGLLDDQRWLWMGVYAG